MMRPEVTVLYRYLSFNIYSLSALLTQTFWFSVPGAFNDPFDCALTVADDALDESIQAALRANCDALGLDYAALGPEFSAVRPEDKLAYKAFQHALPAIFGDVGLLCFSELPDDLLMWSHYADCHRGFVVGFERTAHNSLGVEARPVVYQAAYPRLSAADFYPTGFSSSGDVLWLTKSSHWSYEKEWRLPKAKGNMTYALDSSITEVIFGMRMPECSRAAVRQTLSSSVNVRYSEARRDSNFYRVVLHELPSWKG